jgi:hypothetical protein
VNALSTLAELFIAIAGFAGIVVALSGASIATDPLDRFRVISLLVGTLGGAVFAALPLVLDDAGFPSERVWALASGALSAYLVLTLAWLIRQRLTLPPSALQSLSPVVWSIVLGGYSLSSLTLFVNAAGLVAMSSSGLYLCPLLYLLMLSCLLFVRLLLIRPGSSPAV